MDSYMSESDKQFEQLKLRLQEKSDVIDGLKQDKESLVREVLFVETWKMPRCFKVGPSRYFREPPKFSHFLEKNEKKHLCVLYS